MSNFTLPPLPSPFGGVFFFCYPRARHAALGNQTAWEWLSGHIAMFTWNNEDGLFVFARGMIWPENGDEEEVVCA